MPRNDLRARFLPADACWPATLLRRTVSSSAAHRALRLTTLLVCALAAATLPAATAHRCRGPDGQLAFRQFSCNAGERPEPLALDPLVVVEQAPLSPAQQQRLQALARDAGVRRQRRAQRQRSAARQHAAEQARRDARCARIEADLDALEQQRRHGYRLADAARLRERETRLRADRASVCD
ncbi:MAG: hypothetical protein R3E86_11935 [Pseudomonadales bacterium]